MPKTLTAALCLLTVCACSTTQPPPPTPPANLTQPADPLPLLPQPADLGTVISYCREVIFLYGQCAARHKGLVEAIQDKR